MPSRPSDTTVEPEADELPEGFESYRVAVAATTLETGRRNPHSLKPEVIRLVRGETINAPRDHPSIQQLLSFRAIVPADKYEGKDTVLTAKRVFEIHRRQNEITDAKVDPGVVPVDAPAGHPDIERPV